MIGWLQPAALWGLALVAGPILVHLLRTRYAQRVPFPSLRFVTSSSTAAVRLRPPSDLWLMVLRCAIVALAVCAAAQPLVLTRSRLAHWNALYARAVVVDVSGSMKNGQSESADASSVADAELKSSAHGVRFDSLHLADGISRAAAWLRHAPPARREIVVISDFQLGSIVEADLASLPADVGLRLVRASAPPPRRIVTGASLLPVPGQDGRRFEVELTPDTTRASLVTTRESATGLRMLVPPERQAEAAMLLRAVATAGAPAPAAGEPLAFGFSGGAVQTTAEKPSPWMVRTLARLQHDEPLKQAGRSVIAEGELRETDGIVVARDSRGAALVLAARSGTELQFRVAADVSSYVAAAVVRSVLLARHGTLALPEAEVRAASDAQLTRLTRQPGPVSADAWRQSTESDARWCWLAVLALVGLEQWARRRSTVSSADERREAA